MVMGIIGKQHGVKMDAKPKPKAASRNSVQLCAGAAAPPGVGAGGFTSVNPGGSAMAEAFTAGSIVRFAVPDHLPGMQVVSLQVWKRAAISSAAAPAGASGRVSISSAKDAEPVNVSVWLLKLGSKARCGAL